MQFTKPFLNQGANNLQLWTLTFEFFKDLLSLFVVSELYETLKHPSRVVSERNLEEHDINESILLRINLSTKIKELLRVLQSPFTQR